MNLTDLVRTDVPVDGVTLSIRVGAPSGRNVLFLHGIPGSAATWDRVLAALPEVVRPVVPDLVGFGASGRLGAIDDLHAEGQARRLLAGLAAMDIETAFVVAHDFGGPVALRMLMSKPDFASGLLLAATNAFTDTPVPFPLSLVRAPLIGRAIARMLFSRPSLTMMCRSGGKQARIDTNAALGDGDQAAAIRKIFSESLRRLHHLYEPIEASLPSIATQTDVLWGDHDPFFAIAQGERLAAAIPGARFRVAGGCGHFLPDECPALFATIVGDRALEAR